MIEFTVCRENNDDIHFTVDNIQFEDVFPLCVAFLNSFSDVEYVKLVRDMNDFNIELTVEKENNKVSISGELIYNSTTQPSAKVSMSVK